MKKIGLIGGMSWESSLLYYEIINKKVKEELGGFHSASCVLESVDFAEIENLQHKNEWNSLSELMVRAAKNLENAKADLVILCTNTMHLCSHEIVKNISIPFLHIAEATGIEVQKQKLKKVLLLGTKFTMEKEFYRKLLCDKFDVEVITPDEVERDIIHNVIYEELVHGKINPASKMEYQKIVQNSLSKGAEGVILGCTEIPLLIKQTDFNIPIFNTTRIHAESAVAFSLS